MMMEVPSQSLATTASMSPPDPAAAEYRAERIAHWERVAELKRTWRGMGGAYHRRLAQVYAFHIVPGQRVLEVGCGLGDLLAAVKPAVGVGVDFCAGKIEQAWQRHPGLNFIQADAVDLRPELDPNLAAPFDTIILSDLVNDLWDVQAVFERLKPLTTPRTRLVMNFFSHVWHWPLGLAKRMKLATPTLKQNWLTLGDLSNLLSLAGFESMRHWQEVLFPFPIPLVNPLMNRWVAKLPVFRSLALTNMLIARPMPAPAPPPASMEDGREPTVSVIVPARNEAGNVPAIFDRVPELGGGTELLFVEGNSTDDTFAAIQRELAARPGRNAKLLKQTGKGKGNAVRAGFAQATGDILLILDADLTVAPEDLPRFFQAIRSGKGEFINGVRLVYPMEKRAMRLLNLAGNKFFSVTFSWLLGQGVKDTLCGTKVMWRDDYLKLAANRAYFGDFDPFGDFDLLFGAAKMNLKIVDLPIRYRERTYGTTNIQRWKHGWLLLKMSAFAAGKIKFV
jgi:ubiquinone/menaquinone biosynthesis C-methylase UbiE